MKPTIGRIIIVKNGAAKSNGADRAPAIVTRVWNTADDTRNSPATVNATAMCDMAGPQHFSSVMLFDTEAEGDAYYAPAGNSVFAFWPPRE